MAQDMKVCQIVTKFIMSQIKQPNTSLCWYIFQYFLNSVYRGKYIIAYIKILPVV